MQTGVAPDEFKYSEGGRRYVTPLLAERSRGVVDYLKGSASSACEICENNFADNHGVGYIEAHHKIPISTFEATHTVGPDDFALLCPNCHKAVHIYMKKSDGDYAAIKDLLRTRLLSREASTAWESDE